VVLNHPRKAASTPRTSDHPKIAKENMHIIGINTSDHPKIVNNSPEV
jgi:hypothetical protein